MQPDHSQQTTTGAPADNQTRKHMRDVLRASDPGDILTLRCADPNATGRGIVREQSIEPTDNTSDSNQTISVYIGDTSPSRFEGWDLEMHVDGGEAGRVTATGYVWDEEKDDYVEESFGVVALSINPAPQDDCTATNQPHATVDKRDHGTY